MQPLHVMILPCALIRDTHNHNLVETVHFHTQGMFCGRTELFRKMRKNMKFILRKNIKIILRKNTLLPQSAEQLCSSANCGRTVFFRMRKNYVLPKKVVMSSRKKNVAEEHSPSADCGRTMFFRMHVRGGSAIIQ